MTEKSYLWTTGGAGDGAATYTRSDWAKVSKVLAACRGFEGIAPGYLNQFAGTVPAVNTVRIASGGGIVDGKPYDSNASVDVNIPSAVGAGNTRIDRIVLRADWTAQTVRITRVAGTDAASPIPPVITQNSETAYDITLYQALVNVGGVVVLTDERVFAEIGASKITKAMMANNSVGTAQIEDGSVTQAKLAIPRYGVKAKTSASVNIPTGTLTTVPLGAEEFDDDDMHDLVTNNSRLTCKKAGWYHIVLNSQYGGTNGDYAQGMYVYKNGSTKLGSQVILVNTTTIVNQYYNIPLFEYLEVNDYIEVKADQNSPGQIAIGNAKLSMLLGG